MPRDGAIILGDLVGKLDMLHVECPKCGRAGDVASTAGVMPWPPGWSLPDNSGQNSILARDGLSAYDPTATLAMHCGNDLMRPCSLWVGIQLFRCLNY